MARRGRPNEQSKRETSEGRVWTIILSLRSRGDFGRTIREVGRLSRCSIGAVAKTMAWKGYQLERKSAGHTKPTSLRSQTRQRRQAESVEGRVIQIVKDASSRNDFSLSVRRIADMVGRSISAVGKTEAWKGYVRAREGDKAAVMDDKRNKGNKVNTSRK